MSKIIVRCEQLDTKSRNGFCNGFILEIEQFNVSGSSADVIRTRCKRCGTLYSFNQTLFGEWNINSEGKATNSG